MENLPWGAPVLHGESTRSSVVMGRTCTVDHHGTLARN